MAACSSYMLQYNRRQCPSKCPCRIGISLHDTVRRSLHPALLPEQVKQLILNSGSLEGNALCAAPMRGHQAYTGWAWENSVVSRGEEKPDKEWRKDKCDEDNDVSSKEV